MLELHLLAHKVGEDIANERLNERIERIAYDKGTPEHLSELQRIFGALAHRANLAKFLIVDRFLKNQSRLFVASPDGSVLEIAKSLILPFDHFYDDEDAYVQDRDHSYNCIDTLLWVIDHTKLAESQRQIRDFFDASPDSPNLSFTEHKRFPEYIRSFDGWSLCIAEVDFPKSEEPLKALLFNTPEPKPDERSISKRILAATGSQVLVKSDVRALFPRLSVREFDHHWKLAAQVNPELSKPGRKS